MSARNASPASPSGVNITIPSVGESISEGTIARWLKRDGDQVQQGEPLYELETDKATTEVPAPASGTLHIQMEEGKTVAVGAAIGTIDPGPKERMKDEGGRMKDEGGRMKDEGGKTRDEQRAQGEKVRRRDHQETGTEESNGKPSGQPERPEPRAVASSPAVPNSLAASGQPRAEGRRSAPPAALELPPPSLPAEASTDDDRRVPMSAIRQRIAQRLLAARQETASLTTFNEADLSSLERMRARYKERFQEKHGVKLGIMSFFVKACVRALQSMPIMNARIDGTDIVYPRHCHVGVAVSTEAGLFVPVLRNAEQLTFAQIEKTIVQLADKARTGKISIQDLQDGTFTITNGGVFGSLLSTPLLNPPQSAILGLHTIQKRPVVVNDEVVVRPMMYLALSYDHRIIDGREAVGFLVHVKQLIESPESMLLDVP